MKNQFAIIRRLATITGMKLDRKIAIVRTTVASKREAQKLAALILAKHLGACIQ